MIVVFFTTKSVFCCIQSKLASDIQHRVSCQSAPALALLPLSHLRCISDGLRQLACLQSVQPCELHSGTDSLPDCPVCLQHCFFWLRQMIGFLQTFRVPDADPLYLLPENKMWLYFTPRAAPGSLSGFWQYCAECPDCSCRFHWIPVPVSRLMKISKDTSTPLSWSQSKKAKSWRGFKSQTGLFCMLSHSSEIIWMSSFLTLWMWYFKVFRGN